MKIELINDHYKKIPEPFKKKEIKKLIDVVLKRLALKNLKMVKSTSNTHQKKKLKC